MARYSELQRWKDRMTASNNKFEKTIEPKIKRAWEYYRGNQWGMGSVWDVNTPLYKEKVVENLVAQNVRAIVPKLNFKNPKIFCRPKQKPFRVKDGIFDTIQASVAMEVLLDYQYKCLQIKREARKCLYDALLSPWGIMRLGYTLETEKVQDDELIENNEIIKADAPFAVRTDPRDFRVDVEASDARLNDADWVAFRWVRKLDDVKKDPRFENTSGLKPNFFIKLDFSEAGNARKGWTDENTDTGEPGPWSRVEGWDVWNRKSHELYTIVLNHDRFLRKDNSWPLEIDGFPCETLYFNENATDLFPIPDTWLYLDMQDELNRIGSMQLDHIRRISQRRYIARDNAMTDEEERKLTHGGDGTIAHTQANPVDSILPLQDAAISQDIYIIRNGLKSAIREMAGVSDTEVMASRKFEQATEPALIEQAAQTIRGDQQGSFEDFLVRVIEKLGVIIQQTMDSVSIPLSADQMTDPDISQYLGSKLSKIVGPEGAQMLLPWLEIDKNDIKGEYVYEIQVGSTQPANEMKDKQDAVQLYSMLQQNPYIRPREGTKKLLDAFKVPDPDKLLKSDQEVMQASMMSHKMQIEGEQAIDQPKRDTDLKKTQIKADTTLKVAGLKSQGDQQKMQGEAAAHMMDMMQGEQKHRQEMEHTNDKHMMELAEGAIKLHNAQRMGDAKIEQAKKQNALKEKLKSRKKKEE